MRACLSLALCLSFPSPSLPFPSLFHSHALAPPSISPPPHAAPGASPSSRSPCISRAVSRRRRGVKASMALSGSAWAAATGIPAAAAAAPYYDLFSSLAASPDFARAFGKAPRLFADRLEGIARSFTLLELEEAVDSDFLDAGRGVSGGHGGWKMAAVSQPRGPSFDEAKMRYSDVAASLAGGTVVFNSAGAHIPKLGAVCLAALDAFELPNCLNLYCTGEGTPTSAPPHTDKQDVFVLQTCGTKHWRVYEPPPPHERPLSDPLARGKGDDVLALSELGEPLIDTVLTPGQMLYVPAGFPHTTDTIHTAAAREKLGDAAAGASVHLTVGIDTHIWGLNRLSMRSGALHRARLHDGVEPTRLAPEMYWRLMGVPHHLGFLRRHFPETSSSVAAQLVADVVDANPARQWWASAAEAELSHTLDAAAVTAHVAEHAARMTERQRAMYVDAALDKRPTSPGMPAVSLFRVKGHMDVMEQTMEEHLQWYGPGAVAAAVEAAAGVAPASPSTNKPAEECKGGRSAKGGMGTSSGLGKAVAKKKAGGKKSKSKKR